MLDHFSLLISACSIRVVSAADGVSQSTWIWGAFAIVLVAVHLTRYFADRSRRQRRQATAAPTRPAPPIVPMHPTILPRVQSNPRALEDSPQAISPIQSVRDLMGTPPRSFEPAIQSYLQVAPPPWLTKRDDDELHFQYLHQDRIRLGGAVVWGAAVQANNQIYKPGAVDVGASIIFSIDSYFDERPHELAAIAIELFALKGTDQADPESAAFARMLTVELSRAMMLKVPSRFTSGRRVFHSSMMLSRKHLPKGTLAGRYMPVWVDPGDSGAILLVPAAYWPPSLMAAWDRA